MKTSVRARNTRIAVYPDGRVVVTRSIRTPAVEAEAFVRSKSDWVLGKLEKHKTRPRIPTANPDKSGKLAALKFVQARIMFYNQHYRFNVGRVSIKNHRSLWGSCSRLGNLNFNYKIVHLPQDQADYIIVHELCHLYYFNHSPKFWNLVAETIPDYALIKQALRNYSFY